MEIFIVILLLFIVTFLLASKNNLSDKLHHLSSKIDQMKTELKELKNSINNKECQVQVFKNESDHSNPTVDSKQKTETSFAHAYKKPEIILEQILNTPIEKLSDAGPVEKNTIAAIIDPVDADKNFIPFDLVVEKPIVESATPKNPAFKKGVKEKSKLTFFERHPDLEKFIGENLINKIGIGILVLGIGFFVKYAIDQNWINEIGRVFIGILCGGLLVGIAHKLRKDFAAFSSVLVGGGIAIFYLTIAIAFHEYQIFSQTTSFIIMVGITAFAILLSIAYDRVELAVIAIVGGFGSPFMLSTGEGNYVVLFTYILVLDLGMLILAYFKKWNLVNIICYLFTLLIFGAWVTKKMGLLVPPPYSGALIYATLFYLVFFVMNIINNIKEKKKFESIEIFILLSNTFFYYSIGMYVLKHLNQGFYQGLFTIIVALFNFIFAYTLYKNKNVDKNLVYMLIGLVLSFVSLSAPIQLEGNYITLFWSVEAVLLMWLSQKSKIKLMEVASLIVLLLMGISLSMDWVKLYKHENLLPVILNKAFSTSIVSVASIVLMIKLISKSESIYSYVFENNILRQIFIVLFFVALYASGLLELSHQMTTRVEPYEMKLIATGVYNFIFILAIQWSVCKNENEYVKMIGVFVGILGSFAFLSFYHSEILKLRNEYIELENATLFQFFFHYILTALAMTSLIVTFKIISRWGLNLIQTRVFVWYFTFAMLFILSAELDHIVVLLNYSPQNDTYSIINQNHKIGFPILWGLASFLWMYIGMKYKIKDFRIISLSLFAIILLKLFIVDLRGISEGGKIAAFISLGIILLVVSFMYQKLKNLVLEEETKNDTKGNDI